MGAGHHGIDVVLLIGQDFGGRLEWGDALPTNVTGYNTIKQEIAALSDHDITVVTGAGDRWMDGYPDFGVDLLAADPHTIAAGAIYPSFSSSPVTSLGLTAQTTVPDQVAPYTMRAAGMVEAMAPGSMVTTAANGGGYHSVDGSTYAAAHVAGGLLLMNQYAHERMSRSLHLWEVKELLADTNHPLIDGDNENDNVQHTGATYGRLDLHMFAETLLERSAPAPTSVTLISAPDSDSGISQTDKLTNRNNEYDPDDGVDRRARFIVTGVQDLAMVRLYYNGQQIAFERAGTGGSVMIRTDGGLTLPNGVLNIVATQEFCNADQDPISYESGYSAPEVLTMDATPPALPIRPDLVPASDTGWNAYDNITADTTPTFDFSSSDVDYWEFWRSGQRISDAWMTGSSWTAAAQTDGLYHYVLRSVDEAGNFTDSPSLAVRIDTHSAIIQSIESAGTLLNGSTRTTPVDTVAVHFDECVYNFDVGDSYDPISSPPTPNPGEVMLYKLNSVTGMWSLVTDLASGGVTASPLETTPGIHDYSVWMIHGLAAFTADATQYRLVVTWTLQNEQDVLDDAGNLWTRQSGAQWTQT